MEERGGWFIKNVKDAHWYETEAFGKAGIFENREEQRFPHTGVNVTVLEPGKANCRYHRENGQEDFLVLHGEAKLLVNGEEHALKTWDFVHCPPGVSHVFVGAGDGPCAILMIGHRPESHAFFYPKAEFAKPYNAEAPEPTPDPKVAYSDVTRYAPGKAPKWPLD